VDEITNSTEHEKVSASVEQTTQVSDADPASIRIDEFRQRLRRWYREQARELPWRGIVDPYRTWVSEIMLQQTRVAAVIEHYHRFLARFPTLVALALAPEDDVLALWSGLGYYRRARMLHRAAQFVVHELNGQLPRTADELRTLPGVGEYTSAAIASIAYGESVAVLDGNVERVLLRVLGRPEEATAAGRALVRQVAASLVPRKRFATSAARTGLQPIGANAAGDHNQAMMELGATVCLPRAPLCLQCPVYALCRTRGEHVTVPRGTMRSRELALLLTVRKRGTLTEVLLVERPADASLMPGMWELPTLPRDDVNGRQPLLVVRHAITNTNYHVSVYGTEGELDSARMRAAIPLAAERQVWQLTHRLDTLPLTGLARKVLKRLGVMEP
jgi:A/G-specific adenine glycosylase